MGRRGTEVAQTSPTDDGAGTHREAGTDGDDIPCATGKGGGRVSRMANGVMDVNGLVSLEIGFR
jgi:hypothetical protein